MDYSYISENYKRISELIKEYIHLYNQQQIVELLCVTKTYPAEAIIEAYSAGATFFGENRVQEALPKIIRFNELLRDKNLPIGMKNDVRWHMIGALQSNKVKKVLPVFSMIQSVDRTSLIDELVKQTQNSGLISDILIEVNSSSEPQKSGINPSELYSLIDYILENGRGRLKIKGLMTVGPLTDDEKKIEQSFSLMQNLFNRLKLQYPDQSFPILSMGMSQDFKLAIKWGSTMVRIGSLLFGERKY